METKGKKKGKRERGIGREIGIELMVQRSRDSIVIVVHGPVFFTAITVVPGTSASING